MLRRSTAWPAPLQLDDPYRELGLTAEATDAEVKAAWRRLSARWHPDRNPSPQALQRIQRINRALEDIRVAREQGASEEPPAPAPAAAADDTPIEHTVDLSLEEAACGCLRWVQGRIAQTCAACRGSGEAAEPVPCAACGGHGQLRQTLWFPWLSTPVACQACGGTGSISAPCGACEGSGQAAPLAYRSRMRIPPGVRDGHQLHARVKLQGREGHLGVEVRVRVKAHEFMSLQADGSIHLEMPVDGFDWIAGRWIDVPTPHGMRQMRLQRGALTYRIAGAGFPVRPSGERADCLVTVAPLFPEAWDDQQAALLNQLVASNTGAPATAAGARAQRWKGEVEAWQQRQADAAAG